METKTAIETLINHSALEWTWTIKDVHLNHTGCMVKKSRYVTEWGGNWNKLTSDIFEAGAGTPQHSLWKFSVTKCEHCIPVDNDFDDDEDGLALGIHFEGLGVELGQSKHESSDIEQKVKCLVEIAISGPNSITHTRNKVHESQRRRVFTTKNPDRYKGFLSWAKFCSQRKHLFVDNVIKIQIKLTLIGDTVTKTVLDFGHLSLKEAQTMDSDSDCGKFYNNPDFSDFTIILSRGFANPVQFFAHKFILAARSPVFRRMLETPMREAQENKLVIKDMDLQTLTLMLQFIYKGNIKIPEDKLCIFGLLNAAKLYELKGLSNLVLLKLQSLLTDENVGELTVTAYECARGHEEVISVLRDYCQRRQNILWKNPEYKKLFLQNPTAFMED